MNENPTTQPPAFPAGEYQPHVDYDAKTKQEFVDGIASLPDRLSAAVNGLTPAQFDTRYRNWSIRQIAHHLADSHMHSFLRFKWALVEDKPMIKPYSESDWGVMEDCRTAPVESSVTLLTGLHQRWAVLLRGMTDDQFQRCFDHPETGEKVSLWNALGLYAWHGRHHTAQIEWVRKHRLR